MRFWDASALVPLVVDEPGHEVARDAFDSDPEIITWWATSVECMSALARREREGGVGSSAVAHALRRLDALAAAWQEVEPTNRVRLSAIRLLRVHSLRAADALQLAASIEASEAHPASLPFVTLDDRLADAAAREGFVVIQPM